VLAKGHFVCEKQVEIFGVHEWGFCHEALDMTLGLFLTKVEGFVLIQKNYECSKRQQFGRSRPSGRYIQQSAIGQLLPLSLSKHLAALYRVAALQSCCLTTQVDFANHESDSLS
jgi:hypothetical protein